MTEVDETHICIDCTIIQEELKSQENVSKNLATEIPHRDDEKSQEKALLKLASTTTKLPTNPKSIPNTNICNGIFHISFFKALLINESETTRDEKESGRNDPGRKGIGLIYPGQTGIGAKRLIEIYL
jgi:hypothetical protein